MRALVLLWEERNKHEQRREQREEADEREVLQVALSMHQHTAAPGIPSRFAVCS